MLNSVAYDVLAQITQLLSYQDIGHLWFTGDSRLNRTLGNGGVTTFVFHAGWRTCWPALLANFRELRELQLYAREEEDSKLSAAPLIVTKRHIEELPPTLVLLTLRGNLKVPRGSLELILERFPRLESLETSGRPDWLETSKCNLRALKLRHTSEVSRTAFQYLPKGLMRFSFKGFQWLDSGTRFPESITDLELVPSHEGIYTPYHLRLELPPDLTSLNYYSMGAWTASPELYWPTLPRTLTNLTIRVNPQILTPEAIMCLPRCLLHLRLILTTTLYQFNTERMLPHLPSTLETLDFGDFDLYPNCVLPSSLKEIKTITCENKELDRLIPATVEKLTAAGLAVETNFPPTLTYLDLMFSSLSVSSFSALKNLTALKADFERLDGPMPDLPPLLTDLAILIWNEYSLPSRFPSRLTSLSLEKKPYYGDRTSPVTCWWGDKLPQSLTSLKQNLFMAADWLPQLPTNLSTLHIYTGTRDTDTITNNTLALVPHSVTDLVIPLNQGACLDWNIRSLSHHSNLQSLTVKVSWTAAPWTSDALQDLPKRLGKLVIVMESTLRNDAKWFQEAAKHGVQAFVMPKITMNRQLHTA